jgi:hypothetical protein
MGGEDLATRHPGMPAIAPPSLAPRRAAGLICVVEGAGNATVGEARCTVVDGVSVCERVCV